MNDSVKNIPAGLIDQDIDHAQYYSLDGTQDGQALIQGWVKDAIDDHLAKYPEDQRQSAIMPALTIVQNANNGHLTAQSMAEVAEYLGVTSISVYEVATFYSMYEHNPVGQYKICVCKNISCMLRGSDELLDYLKEKFGVGLNEVSADGKYSIKEVECLGACGGAPAIYIGNDYYENVDPKRMEEILEGLE